MLHQPDVSSTPTRSPAVISATLPDWSREHKPFFAWIPSRSLLASLRAHERWSRSAAHWAPFFRKWASLRHIFWSAVTGADIPLGSQIGGGLLLPHPTGVVIHPHAEIGPNCLIFQQVTVGATERGVPRVGGHVDIGAGAKLLGPIVVGEHARIGANALVIRSVAPGQTVVATAARSIELASSHEGVA